MLIIRHQRHSQRIATNNGKIEQEGIMQKDDKPKNALNISARSFLTATAVIFVLMALCYILTFLIPGGEYSYVTDKQGNTVIDTAAGFQSTEGGIPFWKWLLSPLLVLGTPGGATLIAVLLFLLIIGGAFNSLENCGLMKYMLSKITRRYAASKYRLLAFITFFFMALGSLVGSFEECIPLIPIVVALSLNLGWDALTGLGMSLLAAGCGFAAGVFNPFTVGVAQNLAGLPLFSGASLRLLSFAVIYAALLAFLIFHAKKIESRQTKSEGDNTDKHNIDANDRGAKSVGLKDSSTKNDNAKNDNLGASKRMDTALTVFGVIMLAGIAFVISSTFIPAFQDLTMIIVALIFLIAGIAAPLTAGMNARQLASNFIKGVSGVLPATAMILMAASIRFTLEEAKILGTILHAAVEAAQNMPKWSVILFIYFIVLIMNFFVASGSAKAFMLMPLIVPIAQIFGISPQLCVLAFAFGDGFSNTFYPTNPVLLISLGLADVSYTKWVRWSLKFQIIILFLTSAILMFGMLTNY